MKYLVATINIGNYLVPNVRASMQAACVRWGAQFMEILFSKYSSAFLTQICAAEFLPSDYDRILLIDGDMLIRADCPSPFEIVPPPYLGAVLNFQGDTHDGDPGKYHAPDWDTVSKMFFSDLKYDPSSFFNGGFLLVNPAIHFDTWKWIGDIYIQACHWRIENKEPYYMSASEEQAALNVGFAVARTRIVLLDNGFNSLSPSIWKNKDKMESFIQHYANMEKVDGKKDKREWLESVNWRAT